VTDPKLTAGLVWLQALADRRNEAQEPSAPLRPGIPSPQILELLVHAAGRRPLPPSLDADLTEILGTPNFHAALFAHVFRASGVAVPRKADAEQAFILHWLLGLWFEHGPGWRLAACEAMRAAQWEVKGAA
jgi:hypothetical protein